MTLAVEKASNLGERKTVLGIMAAIIYAGAGMGADPNLQSYRQAVEDADMLLDCIERDEL